MKQEHAEINRLSVSEKILIFLWTIGQWFLIRNTIKNYGFVKACERWKICPTALTHAKSKVAASDQHYHRSCSIHRMVLRAGKCFPKKRTNCLPRALATAFWMQKYGIPHQICIGIRSDDEVVLTSAHAWIEVNGRPIGESKESIAQLKPLAPNLNYPKE